MKNQSKEGKYPCITETSRWDGDRWLNVLKQTAFSSRVSWDVRAKYCNFSLSLSIHMHSRKKKWKLIALDIYLYIYFTADPLDLNIQINTKTTKIALDCGNGTGLQDTCPSWHVPQWSLSPGFFNPWLPPWCCFEWHICWGIQQHLRVIKNILSFFIYS